VTDTTAHIATTAGAVGTFKGGSGFPLRFQGRKSGAYPFFKVSDMNRRGNEVFMTRARNYVSEEERKKMGAVRVPTGAIVFAKVGAAIFVERKRILAQDSCIDNNMAALEVNPSVADVRYVHYLLSNFKMSSLVATTALPSLNGGQLRSIPLLLPKSLTEQRAVVAALAEADDLITVLERLIAKKQAIKKGIMQQVLTGKIRLPGFTKQWVPLHVGAVCTLENGDRGVNYPSPESFVPRGIPFVNAGHLESGQIRFRKMDYITEEAFERLGGGKFNPGDILFCLRGSLGKFGIVRPETGKGAIASSLVIVRPKPRHLSTGYLAAYLASELCAQQIERSAGGAAQPNLGAGDLARFALPVPPLAEQRAIERVLGDVDDELEVLQRRLYKGTAVKDGMMEQLLTGQTSLPTPEVAL
jgi:restriction endonuclease S subunit